jgi:hypothetical protein
VICGAHPQAPFRGFLKLPDRDACHAINAIIDFNERKGFLISAASVSTFERRAFKL